MEISMLSGTKSKLLFIGENEHNELLFRFKGPKQVVERMQRVVKTHFNLVGEIEFLRIGNRYGIFFRLGHETVQNGPEKIPQFAKTLSVLYSASL